MAAQEPIPVYTNLNDLYGNLGTTLNHAEQWNNLTEEFVKRFGRRPAYIARAPGRVNLIGEHIDYALFGVLPAAIEQDILIACAPRNIPKHHKAHRTHDTPGSVVADNLQTNYPREEFAPTTHKRKVSLSQGNVETVVHVEEWHLDINPRELRWESYVKAGYYGVLEHCFTNPAPEQGISIDTWLSTQPIPVDLLVTGSVPAGSGLSSSAAMVVASTLAFLGVNGKLDNVEDGGSANQTLTKGQLVKMAMENERRVGVNSGGMDQAASVTSTPLSALYITFYPALKASPVPLPKGAVFVCANSLVVADKVVGAKTRYNLRVVETLVGARVLARALGIQLDNVIGTAREKVTYREVIGRFAGEQIDRELEPEVLADVLEELGGKLGKLKSKTGDEGVTLEEMVEMSGLNETEFKDTYLSWVEVEATHFQLYKRAKHVLSEAKRVLQFRNICLMSAEALATASQDQSLILEQLGNLMDASQESCSELYECSCPELNQLTKLAREAGAYGSRLTGAGWGGCTVSLVAESQAEQFIKKIRDTYPPFKGLEGERLSEVIFATKPSSGACVYKFT